mmetsp:Transcript_19568/g.33588  ORF Transcript_19568/g.33588 Transcript_19568/m.33588 type:complete len:284 (-) Transcript_19568:326-1177(-)
MRFRCRTTCHTATTCWRSRHWSATRCSPSTPYAAPSSRCTSAPPPQASEAQQTTSSALAQTRWRPGTCFTATAPRWCTRWGRACTPSTCTPTSRSSSTTRCPSRSSRASSASSTASIAGSGRARCGRWWTTSTTKASASSTPPASSPTCSTISPAAASSSAPRPPSPQTAQWSCFARPHPSLSSWSKLAARPATAPAEFSTSKRPLCTRRRRSSSAHPRTWMSPRRSWRQAPTPTRHRSAHPSTPRTSLHGPPLAPCLYNKKEGACIAHGLEREILGETKQLH